jgi:hypothetical protein
VIARFALARRDAEGALGKASDLRGRRRSKCRQAARLGPASGKLAGGELSRAYTAQGLLMHALVHADDVQDRDRAAALLAATPRGRKQEE